jgi:hypothetical protein
VGIAVDEHYQHERDGKQVGFHWCASVVAIPILILDGLSNTFLVIALISFWVLDFFRI